MRATSKYVLGLKDYSVQLLLWIVIYDSYELIAIFKNRIFLVHITISSGDLMLG